jgi:hypothetical protein
LMLLWRSCSPPWRYVRASVIWRKARIESNIGLQRGNKINSLTAKANNGLFPWAPGTHVCLPFFNIKIKI